MRTTFQKNQKQHAGGQRGAVIERALVSSATFLGLVITITPAMGDDVAVDPSYSVLTDITVKQEYVSPDPASITTVEYSERYMRNIREYEDILKPITGVISNNFDQGGPGYGFTMRGFGERNNGSQTALYLDGVPLNQPSHQLSNGYGDLGFIIPDLIGSLKLVRGPFDVRDGANALGGSLRLTTRDDPTTSVTANGGSYDYARGLGVYNFDMGETSAYVSFMGKTTNGYRDNTGIDSLSTYNKLKFAMPGGRGSLSFLAYNASYDAPGYVNRTLIKQGVISDKAARNPTDGGSKEVQMLTFNYKQDSDQWFSANGYIWHTDNARHASFATGATGLSNTIPIPGNTPGVQRVQMDDRVMVGGTVEKYFSHDFSNDSNVDLLVGAGVKADFSDQEEWNTTARVKVSLREDLDVDIVNPYFYFTGNYTPFEWITLTGGVRFDYLDYDIDGLAVAGTIPVSDVSADNDVTSPTVGVIISPFTGLGIDIFANYGEGFRPVQANGDELPFNPGLDKAKLESWEVGMQYNSPDNRWHFRASRYETDLTNETRGQGQTLPPIQLGASRRIGWDVEGRADLIFSKHIPVSLFANFSTQDAKLTEPTDGAAKHVPDVANYLIKYGFDANLPIGNGFSQYVTVSFWQAWEGPKSLNTLDTITTSTFSRINANLTYTNANWNGLSAFLGVIAYTGDRLSETAFLYGTQVGVSAKAPIVVTGGISIPF